MNRLETFSCYICKKIQKQPVYLPCLCVSVCQHHIKDLIESQQKDSIKCFECLENFDVEKDVFKPNKQLAKLLKLEDYLTEDEKRQKLDLIKNTENLMESYGNFKTDYTKFQAFRVDHFEEVRRKVELRRVELIEQIEEASKNLLEKLKEVEESFNTTVKESFQSQNADYELDFEFEHITEMFRCVNLNQDEIKEKENEQTEKLKVLNEEFSRLESYKNDLIKNVFNQNDEFKFEASQFGLLEFKEIFKSMNQITNFFNSREEEINPENYEPLVQFKALVKLKEVEVKTGEEDEQVVLKQRSKLFRFDRDAKEWKEKGLGDIKIMKHKETGVYRVLMRREYVLKICANHCITAESKINEISSKQLSWLANDFSDNQPKTELFLAKFKTDEDARKFKTEFELAVEANKAVKPTIDEIIAEKNENECCTIPKIDNTQSEITKQKEINKSSIFMFGSSDESTNTAQIFSFHPLLSTKNNLRNVNKLPSKPIEPSSNNSELGSEENHPKSFTTYPHQISKSLFLSNNTTSEKSSYLPKDLVIFGSAQKKIEVDIENNNQKKNLFDFGLKNPTFANNSNDKTKSESINNFVSKKTPTPFNFASKEPVSSSVTLKCLLEVPTKNLFTHFSPYTGKSATTPFNTNSENPVLFSNISDHSKDEVTPLFSQKVGPSFADLATNSQSIDFGGGFKDKTALSKLFGCDQKTFGCNKEIDEKEKSDDENENENEFEPQIEFKPIVNLAEVEVKTGEEDEEIVFKARCKLYRFNIEGKDWKEKGAGEIKILRHKVNTNSYRVLMRRDQILKICANHRIYPEIKLEQENENQVRWFANEFYDGKINAEFLAAKFRHKTEVDEFSKEFEKAQNAIRNKMPCVNQIKQEGFKLKINDLASCLKVLDGSWNCVVCLALNKPSNIKCACCEKIKVDNSCIKGENDFTIETVIQATYEQKQMAKKFMLPENFYLYLNKSPCKGCFGCQND